MSFGPGAAYLVDVLHSRSAESLAANRFVFFFFADGFRGWNEFNLILSLLCGLPWLLFSALRAVLVALAVAATLPMIEAYGILVTHALCAILVWISFVYVVFSLKKKKSKIGLLIMIFRDIYSGLWYVIKYGDQMRAWVDVGFSTAEDHWKQHCIYPFVILMMIIMTRNVDGAWCYY